MKRALFGAILAAGCAAPSGPIELASGTSATSLATDGANVYWTTRDGVMKCASTGCDAPTRIATASAPSGLAVASGRVFFTTASGVFEASNGSSTLVAPATHAWSVATSASRVYWTTNAVAGPVMTCPLEGCAGAPAPLAGSDASFAIATDEANVYWSDQNAIWTCPSAGCVDGPAEGRTSPLGRCAATPLAAVAGHVTIAVDDAKVYWAYADEGLVFSCDKHDCGEPGVVATKQQGATAIASDGKDVYWLTSSAVMRCATSGCMQPTRIAALSKAGTALAVGADDIWFADDDRVMKIAKN